MNKYRNRKITSPDGQVFDSGREYARYNNLKMLQNAGIITDLKRQVKFVLIPTQRAYTTEVYKKGKHKGELKLGKVIEKECAYYADFTYKKNGILVVEDTKGVKTKDYILKRKMMLYFYGIRIREV